ncbi:MAG: C25 family cysteine peptidase [Acidobacteriota bacterium]
MKTQLKTFALVALSAVLATTLRAQTTVVRDTFTGTNGTTLQAHNPTTGNAGSWFNFIGTNLQIQTNSLRTTSNGGGAVYGNTTTPASGQYATGLSVTFTTRAPADGTCNTAAGAAGNFTCNENYAELFGRADATAQNGYLVRITSNGQLTLIRIVAGTLVTLASTTIPAGTNTLNVAHSVVLSMTTAAKQVYFDDVLVLTSADNTLTGATAAGRISGIGENTVGANQTVIDDFFVGTFAVTEARLLSSSATQEGTRTLVEWTTGQEVNNLGYRVYREAGKARHRVGDFVAGSAFLVRGASLASGNTYRVVDTHAPARRKNVYWIEEIDVRGPSQWFGPVEAEPGTIDPEVLSSATLSSLSQLSVPADSGIANGAVSRPASGSLRIQSTATDDLPQGERQYSIAAADAVKLYVAKTGWYRVTVAELIAAGLDPKANAKTLHLWAGGREVPMTVEGEESNRVDAIRFYGVALDTPATNEQVYWLAPGFVRGDRIPSVKGTAATETNRSYLATVERKDKLLFFAALDNGENDSFFGPLVSTQAASPTLQTLDARNVDTTVSLATVNITLQGGSDIGSTSAHRVTITLNGRNLGDVNFSGQQRLSSDFAVSASLLVNGSNVVGLVAQNGEEDISVVESVRITYAHRYVADGGALLCTATGAIRIDGFSGTDVRLLDVTDPASPSELAVVATGGSISAKLSTGQRRLFAVTPAGFAHPVRIEANVPSSVHKSANKADIIIIASRAFVPALTPLVSLRQSQGQTVAVAAIDDVYDEFSAGVKDPAAIRSFLRSLKSPKAVLLFGDASFDERNYLGLGDFDFVPTKLVMTSLMKTASDGWFTDLNGDSIPDVAIGRLPVRTAAGASAAVSKILRYEQAPAGQPWSRKVLFVNDVDPTINFRGELQSARAALPAGLTPVNIDVAASGIGAARAQLLSQWNDGASVIDYSGHGSVEVWTGNGLFGSSDASGLTNGTRLPVVVAMTCLNGYFHDLYTKSMVEALVGAPNGGAIAMFASSSLTEPEAQRAANTAFVRALYTGVGATFGDAAMAAWRASSVQEFRRSFMLFGDPSTRLRTQ